MEVTSISNRAFDAAYANVSVTASQKATSNAQQQKEQNSINSANNPVSQGKDSIIINSTSVTSRNLSFIRDVEEKHVNMNRLATGVRETNEALVKVAQQAREMQGNTFAIIKNFPPFTPESSERMAILMSYSSLQNEILKMTVPPPPPPIYEAVKHLWNNVFENSGQLKVSTVPILQTNSSDNEIKSAATSLDELGRNLDALSSATAASLIGS